ncbi:Gfo/Idh/MocA family oxidoreductase [Streptomyces sp. NPDC090798]|uniref:Gfo/Idh/MocA family oxidoreductase n=1 Tax=Streptomyces sp. NPDC090798 TaxID=3365968 RepID=UPI00382427CA
MSRQSGSGSSGPATGPVTGTSRRCGRSRSSTWSPFRRAARSRWRKRPLRTRRGPDVDLVAVLTPMPERVPLVKAAIEAGKDVYSEWPLTTRTSDSEELLSLAEAKGVRHVLGLQRKAPRFDQPLCLVVAQ